MRGTGDTGETKRKPGWRKVKARVVRPFDGLTTHCSPRRTGSLFSVFLTVGNHWTRYPR